MAWFAEDPTQTREPDDHQVAIRRRLPGRPRRAAAVPGRPARGPAGPGRPWTPPPGPPRRSWPAGCSPTGPRVPAGGEGGSLPGRAALRRRLLLYRRADAGPAGQRPVGRRGAAVVHLLGHRPRGRLERPAAEVRRHQPDLLLDPEAAARSAGVRTSAILATHTYGTPCDVEALQELAGQNGSDCSSSRPRLRPARAPT